MQPSQPLGQILDWEFLSVKQAYFRIIKQLVIPTAGMPLLYKWAHLEKLVVIAAFSIDSCIRL